MDLRPKSFWRKKTPTIIQMEAVECGAAALAIILGYYGKWIPLEELRLTCGVSRNGSNALNVVEGARSYGLEAKGFRKEVADLFTLEVPAILFWEYNHFVVLEGFSKGKVFINDPSVGPRSISYQELDEAFTGIVLTFSPAETFEKGGKPLGIFEELFRLLKRVKSGLNYLWLAGLCLILPGIALPALARIFIDDVLTTDKLAWKVNFILFVALGAFLAGSLNLLRNNFLNRINAALSLSTSSYFLRHILRLPIAFYTQRFSGEIAWRTQLNNKVAETISGPLATTCIDLLLIVFYLVMMFFYDVKIAFAACFFGSLNLVALYFLQRRRQDAYAQVQQEMGKVMGFSIGGIQNIESIKLTGTESDFFSRLAGHYTRLTNARTTISRQNAFIGNLPQLLQIFALTTLLGIGAVQILEGSLSAGMLIALQILIINFLTPINNLMKFGELIQMLKIDLARINDVMKNPQDSLYTIPSKKMERQLEGKLEFRAVTFGYAPLDPPLIKELNFCLEPGKRIAIVGPTGSGKSTLAKLTTALYRPWKGTILYDGKPIEETSPMAFHHSLASVDQEIFLFAGTIKENLTLWDRHVSDEALINAARDAEIHHEILQKIGGYDALLTEGGRNLSGGERQRIEIARALIYNPTLLVLDEATSALDSENEKKISDNLRRRGCSCIMIAHRLSTIQDCDEILVLDQGTIVQRGTHEQLSTMEGVYRTLIEGQGTING